MTDDFLSILDTARLNRNKIIHYVKNHGDVSRTDIWNNMSISRASVTQIIRQLQDMNLIVETGEKAFSGRRMSRYLTLNKDARYQYIFDWNTHLLCLVNLIGEIILELPLTFPKKCSPGDFAKIVLDGIDKLTETQPINTDELLGLGLILPGIINHNINTLLYSVELGWQNININELFSERFGEAVFLERSSNMIALGECVGGTNRPHTMLVLLDYEGIGMSTVVHGSCQHGCNFMYGELGHIKLSYDTPCSCGQKGCLEAIVQEILKQNNGSVTDEVLEYISFGVSTAINICDPGEVLLSGNLVWDLKPEQRNTLLNSIRLKIANEDVRLLDINVCDKNNKSAIKGMCQYIFENTFPAQ